jgi:hypothetical protein
MYAASTAAVRRASVDAESGWRSDGIGLVLVLSLVLWGMALSSVRKFDDHRSRKFDKRRTMSS